MLEIGDIVVCRLLDGNALVTEILSGFIKAQIISGKWDGINIYIEADKANLYEKVGNIFEKGGNK